MRTVSLSRFAWSNLRCRFSSTGRRNRASTASLLVLCASVASAETLTVEDAVKRALDNSPQANAARERQQAAEDQARAVRGQFLPALSVADQFDHYDTAFNRTLSLPGVPAASAPSLAIRDQNTNTFVAQAKQPILGLVKISQDYMAADANADATKAGTDAANKQLTEAVETTYLRLFEAKAAREVARASQQQLDEQLEVSKARVKAGAMTNADVLRVQVARANIQQQELQASVQESAARTQLLTLLAMPLDAQVDFAEPVTLEAEAEQPIPTLAEATNEAVAKREDLHQQVRLLDSADATARARLAALLPDVDVVGAYTRIDGQQLALQNQWSVGLRVSWAFWLWGSQWYAHRAAVHQANAARLMTGDADRQVRGEVSGRLDQLRAATSAIDVAKTALASAEEAYRVTSELVKAGSGTTTDLLDSQSALTQSKLNLVRSRYQQAQARVQLRRAMGG